MTKDLLLILRYLISSEESRIGRRDYWNSVFLAERSPLNRTFLSFTKVLFVITLCTALMVGLNRL